MQYIAGSMLLAFIVLLQALGMSRPHGSIQPATPPLRLGAGVLRVRLHAAGVPHPGGGHRVCHRGVATYFLLKRGELPVAVDQLLGCRLHVPVRFLALCSALTENVKRACACSGRGAAALRQLPPPLSVHGPLLACLLCICDARRAAAPFAGGSGAATRQLPSPQCCGFLPCMSCACAV